MKKIIVVYWGGRYLELEYEHNSEFDYSIDKQREIIENIISKGFSVMVRPKEDYLLIWIDKFQFGQR